MVLYLDQDTDCYIDMNTNERLATALALAALATVSRRDGGSVDN
jgi:hypothetical protein